MNTRRTFLTGTAAVAAGSVLSAPSAPAAASPDAELIAACAEFSRLNREFGETDFDAKPFTARAARADAEQKRISDLMKEASYRIVELQPGTLEGHQARARALLSFAPELGEEGGCTAWSMRAAILRDLAKAAVA